MTSLRTAWEIAADEIDPPDVDTDTDPFPTPGALDRHLNRAAWDYPHLDLIDEHLVRLIDGQLGTRGLMVFTQPRAGKSRRCSRVFPLWYLRRRPTHRLAVGTYGQALGNSHSRWIRNTIDRNPSLGLRLAGDSKAVDDWELAHSEGGLVARGIGAGITGRGANGIVIDDPVKNREEAESQTMRDKTWDWWTDDLSTRLTKTDELEPWVLLMMTRWHEDDLAGRLLSREPEHWTVLTLPALAENNDPLGRRPGETLMPDRYGDEWMAEQKARLGIYSFGALYQQRPSPAEGSLFHRSNFRYWHREVTDQGERWVVNGRPVHPDDCWRFATADTASSTKTSADWSVVSAWAVTPDSELLLLDRARQRMGESELLPFVRAVAERNRCAWVGVEATFGTTTLAYEMGVAGITLVRLKADTDKITRSIPAQVRSEQHRVYWPAGAGWLDEWESELLAFPNGAHDDQVDTFSYAALRLDIRGPKPVKHEPATPDERLWAAIAKKRSNPRRGGVIGAA